MEFERFDLPRRDMALSQTDGQSDELNDDDASQSSDDAHGRSPEQAERPPDQTEIELQRAIASHEQSAARLSASAEQFADAVSALEGVVQSRVNQEVRAACCTLLPQLAKAMLPEEIARHLASLTIAPARQLRLAVGAQELCEPMREALDQHTSISDRVEIIANSDLDELRVELSWQNGGIDFEFDRLLEALCASLGGGERELNEPGEHHV